MTRLCSLIYTSLHILWWFYYSFEFYTCTRNICFSIFFFLGTLWYIYCSNWFTFYFLLSCYILYVKILCASRTVASRTVRSKVSILFNFCSNCFCVQVKPVFTVFSSIFPVNLISAGGEIYFIFHYLAPYFTRIMLILSVYDISSSTECLYWDIKIHIFIKTE